MKELLVKYKFILFIILFVIFSIGLFFGELLLDTLINDKRDALKTEIIDAIFTGFICSCGFLIGSKVSDFFDSISLKN
ncbi:hypothetical protein [Polaribacter sargassicola]|uniref:hypothetical protein n=1 Tax=Polaribacter sargassicola TaxID=2836891 RepID=UPI001F45494F|nr:hypothetical protein [Polaribacter sp. DS7-9]MCG1035063.1 hypothetical protein [Polaribacter sp. DS7-9]